MEITKILSKDNEKIKNLRRLKQKKYRDKENKFFVENLNIINDGVRAGFQPKNLFVTENFLNKNYKQFKKILTKTKLKRYYLINKSINKYFSNLSTPSGICALYQKEIKNIKFNKPIIYLNGVHNPGNLGTILRSAVAFDFVNVVLDENCVDLYNPKVISSAKDAIFKLNIEIDNNFNLLKKIKEKTKIFSTKLTIGKKPKVLNKEKNFCLVFGSEAHGISKEIEKISNDFIKINMSNNIESINVAISAGIIFYNYYN